MNKAATKKTDKTVPAKEDKARSKSKGKEEKIPAKPEKPEKKQVKKKEESSDSEESAAEARPKKNLNAYMFFNMDNREKVKKENPGIANKEILSVKNIFKIVDPRKVVEGVLCQ
jgi:hypothetical protein